MLELLNIIKVFPKENQAVRPLNGVSLSIKSGEFVAINGPSGSGKTTLLLTAGGLLRPDRGRVIINGQDLYEKSPDERARFRAGNIGFVFQQYHLIPYLTVIENILVPNLAYPITDALERARQLIENFGLTRRQAHTPAELSVGEKQRTALARALLHQPKILFADEITGNLDRKNSDIILDYLKEFARSGAAVLLVTHDERAAQSAHRRLYLNNGKFEGKSSVKAVKK